MEFITTQRNRKKTQKRVNTKIDRCQCVRAFRVPLNEISKLVNVIHGQFSGAHFYVANVQIRQPKKRAAHSSTAQSVIHSFNLFILFQSQRFIGSFFLSEFGFSVYLSMVKNINK